MSYLKTKVNDADVVAFINALEDDQKREDCWRLLSIIKGITKLEPKMWGKRIAGFGNYIYKTKAGKEGEWFLIGLSPTKSNISLHLMFGLEDENTLLSQLGKYKMRKGCLYIKTLSDIDENILIKLMTSTYQSMQTITSQDG